MSNSTRVIRHSMSATVATMAVVALMVGLFVGLPGTSTASGSVVGGATPSSTPTPTASPSATSSPSPTETPTSSPTATVSPSPTPTASPSPTESMYPEAHGWKNERNGVQYHIDHDKGVVYFWTTMKDNYGMLVWDSKVLESDRSASFWYGDPPKEIKYRKCGVRVKIEVYGYEYPTLHTLPALRCQPRQEVFITKVKKAKKASIKVLGRTGMVGQVRSGRLVVQDLTKTTARRCAWVKPNGKLKYTRRTNGVCSVAKAPSRGVTKKGNWAKVVKVPKRHRLRVVATVRYSDGAVKRDAARYRRR